MNKTIIAIDGNINTGKTSLFEKFMLAYPSASFSIPAGGFVTNGLYECCYAS